MQTDYTARYEFIYRPTHMPISIEFMQCETAAQNLLFHALLLSAMGVHYSTVIC